MKKDDFRNWFIGKEPMDVDAKLTGVKRTRDEAMKVDDKGTNVGGNVVGGAVGGTSGDAKKSEVSNEATNPLASPPTKMKKNDEKK